MTKQPNGQGISLRLPVFAVCSILLLQSGCTDPTFGINTKSTAKETADNGDDSDGPAKSRTYPDQYANDGGTLAVSNPIDYRQFFVITSAQVGRNASRLAIANALGETTSTFKIDKLWGSQNVTFSVHAVVTPNIVSGVGKVYYSLALTNATTGVAVTPLQTFSYDFRPSQSAPAQIDVKLNGTSVKSTPNGARYEDVHPLTLKLKNGDYKFDLTWDVISSADGKAELTANVYVLAD